MVKSTDQFSWDIRFRIAVRAQTKVGGAGQHDSKEVAEEMQALHLALQRTLEAIGYDLEAGQLETSRELVPDNAPVSLSSE